MPPRGERENARVKGGAEQAGVWDRFTERDLNLLAELREPVSVALSNYRGYQELLELKDRLAEDCSRLKQELAAADEDIIIGSGLGLKRTLEMVRQVAPLDSPVLVTGESGTGKALITRAIHRLSGRREGPFIKVNCGAMADSLVDSELFGHEKGAFTGALYLKRGMFERAHGGTLFLDEIGELPVEFNIPFGRKAKQE